MIKRAVLICMLLTSAIFTGLTFAAGDPTLHEVYQAADAGRLSEALGMMNQVLRDHPNSGKAHFVEAELLAKQGKLASAATELATAERLAPGLPFAKADSVENLKRRVAPSHTTNRLVQGGDIAQSASASQFPWSLLLVGAGLIAAIVFFVSKMKQSNAAALPGQAGAGFGTGFGSSAPLQPVAGGGGFAQPMGPAAGGMGSRILGGLATGAAVGVGMVAAESLMHRFTDGNRHETGQTFNPVPDSFDSTPNDMGGNDFGVSDASSWDDSSSGGGDDWK